MAIKKVKKLDLKQTVKELLQLKLAGSMKATL